MDSKTLGNGLLGAIFMAAGAMVFFSTLATQWAAAGAMDAMTFVWYLVAFIILGIAGMFCAKSGCCAMPVK